MFMDEAHKLRQRVEEIGGDLAEKSVKLKHKTLEVRSQSCAYPESIGRTHFLF